MNTYRLEICGGIASGKTTCASLLGHARAGFIPLLEDFTSNPFWEAFYKDPSAVAFETELTFFLQHYHQIKQARVHQTPLACDHSLLLDLAYARVTLAGPRLAIFADVFAEIWHELEPPKLLVYLRCDSNTELARIRRRAREAEKDITLSYLQQLNESLHSVINEYSSVLRILEIDSSAINFAEQQDAKQYVTQEILALSRLT